MNQPRKNSGPGPYAHFAAMPFVMIAGALICAPASAIDGDTFTPYVTYGVYYDANLLRLPEAQAQSDRWTRAEVGIRMDKEIGRQKLTADLSANKSNYDNFNQYDNDGKDLLANWKWVLGNQFSGNVGTSYSDGLTPFDDYKGLERSMRTQQKNYVDGTWRFHPSWQLNAAYNRFDLRYDTQAQNPSERKLDMTDVGIDYLAKSGNKIGLVARHIEGDYPYADINSYQQNELKAKVDWQLTGKTYLQFLGGWAKREYASNPQRDSSVPSARLTAYWKATGKTAFSLGVWRELGATDDLAANYARNQGISLGSTWDATSKISVDGLIMTEKRDYNGVAVIAGIAPSNRDDRYNNAVLGLTYKPTLHWRVRASVYRTTLDSNVASATYKTNGAMITTRYEF